MVRYFVYVVFLTKFAVPGDVTVHERRDTLNSSFCTLDSAKGLFDKAVIHVRAIPVFDYFNFVDRWEESCWVQKDTAILMKAKAEPIKLKIDP